MIMAKRKCTSESCLCFCFSILFLSRLIWLCEDKLMPFSIQNNTDWTMKIDTWWGHFQHSRGFIVMILVSLMITFFFSSFFSSLLTVCRRWQQVLPGDQLHVWHPKGLAGKLNLNIHSRYFTPEKIQFSLLMVSVKLCPSSCECWGELTAAARRLFVG